MEEEEAESVGAEEEQETGARESSAPAASPKRKGKSRGPPGGSGTGSSTSPAKAEGGLSSSLEAQLTALLPALLEIVQARNEFKAATQAAMQTQGGAQSVIEKQQTPIKNGLRTGADGLRPGDEGFRSAVTAVAEATVGEPAAAARAGAAAAAQAQKEERARILAEKREAGASALTPNA
mgnify:CR=1 FL=1